MPKYFPIFAWMFISIGTSVNAEDEQVDFSRKVRPILAKACFACHGNDAGTREADLRLDVRAEAIAERDGLPAITPYDVGASEMISRLTTDDDDLRMPPSGAGEPLTEEQVSLIKRWIEQGARYSKHWAFVKPREPRIPITSQPEWPRNEIDAFVLARMERRGLKPSGEADRYTLIRRLYLDLIGVPPAPDDVDRFVHDTSPQAYEKIVDRLLNSPRFGERWAQMWLDLARYADSMGYEKDLPRTIWRYRDWVIDAFNRDLTFDQFTMEQLAGDLMADATVHQKLATAMHRNTLTNQEGGTDDEEFRVAAVKDRVDTTMQVWMGITMGCAKCHSHKYDPITIQNYYQFFAFFNQTADADRGNDSPTIPTPTRQQQQRMAELDQQIADLENAVAANEPSKARLVALKKERAAIKPPTTPVMQQLPKDKQRVTNIHVRGNFLEKGEVVEPGVPVALGAFPPDASEDRLGVAQWLVHPDNPLTARVQVNRFWARLFGRGIVTTEEDFGTQGAPPTHAELLDWMALEFIRREWSVKEMLRLIVCSATYRQSSLITPDLEGADPQNTWLARGPRFRLEAETVHDQALSAAGLLSDKMHGPSVMPPQPPGVWRVTYSKLKWQTSRGEDRHRRALYTYWRRTSPYPSMLTFDAGTRETCVIRRIRTNTPLQALVTMNDPVYVEAAGGLATRIVNDGGDSNSSRAEYGFRLAVIREPVAEERDRLLRTFTETVEHFRQQTDAADALIRTANAKKPSGWPVEEFAAWIVVGNVLLNLDEIMTKP